MSTESIQAALRQRFAAAMPEFYQRRIIFWHDEDREFEALAEQISIPDVTVVKLTGTNNFAVKKLLLHDDPTGNYLIYDPFSHAGPQDNWLRDIEKYSEEYRADLLSMQMRELNIVPSASMRRTVKQYAKFLESRERRQKLRRIGREYETPLQLHVDIMAVLAGVGGGTAQDVLMAVLSGSLDVRQNTVLENIRKFGQIDAFWQLARKYTGYIHADDQSLGAFAAHILLTAAAQTMNAGIFRGLERFISESNQAYCYSLVHEWRGRGDGEALFRCCRAVEQELQLAERFDRLEIETLLTGDVFPAIHESIIRRFCSEAAEQVVRTGLMLKTAEDRRTAGWHDRFAPCYDCLYYLAKMQAFYTEYAAGFHLAEPKQIWKLYTDTAWQMDSWYRHFCRAFGQSLKNGSPRLEDGLKQMAEYAEGLYQNWYLPEINGCWTNAAADDLAALGYVSEIGRQRDFYARYIRPMEKKTPRAFVIISDALRYEVARELCEQLNRSTRGTARLEAVQATFPAITKFGMASLLPGVKLSVNDRMEVLVDGRPTRSTADRQKVLQEANPNSVAVQYSAVLDMKRSERRALASGRDVIYIYHNTIDAIGDKAPTEKKVFDACADTVQELADLLRIVVSDMQGTDIFITADHGFLYTARPLAEADRISRKVFSGAVHEVGRRYALTEPNAAADCLLPVRIGAQIGGVPLGGFTPRESVRIKIPGGGENYVHGGVSLQEMVVPVISFKNLRTSSKNYVEVSGPALKLLSESRRISNLSFSLDFFQSQPVGGKIRPCVYTVYMADETGAAVSDRQTVIADRTSANASERVFHVRFNLKAGDYSPGKQYRLVIAGDTDTPEETAFRIDIAVADDFDMY